MSEKPSWLITKDTSGAGLYKKFSPIINNYFSGLPGGMQETDYLRASSIHNICPRQFVLNYWLPKKNTQFTGGFANMATTLGTLFHEYMQNVVLGPLGILKGNWLSVRPGETVKNYIRKETNTFHPDPEKAIYEYQAQLPLTWHFEENILWDEEHRISGHNDGIVCIEKLNFLNEHTKLLKSHLPDMLKKVQTIASKETAVLEMKSHGSRVFQRLDGFEDIADYYKTQAAIYMWKTNQTKCLFLHFERDFFQFKSIELKFQDVEQYLKKAQRKANYIWNTIREERNPDDKPAWYCNTEKDKLAKSCSHSKICFSQQIEAEEGWEKWVAKCKANQPNRKFLFGG